jgi:hypothetical protein
VAVPLAYGRIGAEAVQIPSTLNIVKPDALSSGDYHVQRMVVSGAIGFFEIDIVLAVWPTCGSVAVNCSFQFDLFCRHDRIPFLGAL